MVSYDGACSIDLDEVVERQLEVFHSTLVRLSRYGFRIREGDCVVAVEEILPSPADVGCTLLERIRFLEGIRDRHLELEVPEDCESFCSRAARLVQKFLFDGELLVNLS